MIKKTLVAVMFAASLGAVAAPASAAVWVRTAPPDPRVEVVPAPRRGHTWAPGYWGYRGHRHVWVAGSWVRNRAGYHYNHARWVEQDGRWRLENRRWARGDRDGDGVPNSVDRHPNNPRRN